MGEKNNKNKKVKEKISEALDIPREIIMDLPKIIFTGNKELSIENYAGIIEYDDKIIRINTHYQMIKITGEHLEINSITAEEIFISGNITSLEFID